MTIPRASRLVGALLWVGAAAGLLALALAPGVRGPLLRVGKTLVRDALGSAVGEVRLPLTPTSGLKPGDPLFLAGRSGGLEPVAYVTRLEGEAIVARFAPGEDARGPWRLERLDAPRTLGELVHVAAEPAALERLAAQAGDEVRRLLDTSILPALEARLPAFLARLDPRHSPRARLVLDAVGASIVVRLQPLGDDLARHVAEDLEDQVGLLQRLGLLWKLVQGDAEGLRKSFGPLAAKSAARWWDANRDAVLTAVGEGVAAEAPRWQAWILDDVLPAAREELAEPVLREQAPALEAAAQRLLDRVVADVVEDPDGGFRLRFAAALRMRLLEKDGPLLLLERGP